MRWARPASPCAACAPVSCAVAVVLMESAVSMMILLRSAARRVRTVKPFQLAAGSRASANPTEISGGTTEITPGSRREHAELARGPHGVLTRLHPELRQDGGDMAVDRANRYHEAIGDHGVRQSLGEQPQYADLSVGQALGIAASEVRGAARNVPHPAITKFGAHPAGERYGADAVEDRERLEQIGLIGALGERGGLVVGTSGCSPEVGGSSPVAARLDRERMLVVIRDLDLVAGAHQKVGELGPQRAGHEAVGFVELRTCDGAGRGEVATQQRGLGAGGGDRSAPLQFSELVGE